MPPGSLSPRPTEFWRRWRSIRRSPRGGHFLGVIARLKPGVTLEQAGAEMKTIAERLARSIPTQSANESAEVVPLHEQIVGAIRPAL